MNHKLLEVLQYEGPVTIVTGYKTPVSIVNTWMSYIQIDQKQEILYIPAAGMKSIEIDFKVDNRVTIVVGSKEVKGTMGLGAGFHIYGHGEFISEGQIIDQMKIKFPWIRKVLRVTIDRVEQKI
ncbi:hypothetical protein IGK38_003050 [Enterococcus pernyi]